MSKIFACLRRIPERLCRKRGEDEILLELSHYKAYLNTLEPQVTSRLESCGCPREDIAQFEILGKLGEGSFGVVVKARYLRDNELYAIKIQLKQTAVSKERTKEIIREKVIQYAAASEFVVELKFVFQDNARLYLMMEYSPYGDFARCFLCNKRWTATEKKVRLYAAQVVLGLEFLHMNNITLRDLKPPNCIVFSDGYLKLSDFGFAKASRENMYSIVGTEPYIAPEVMMLRGYLNAVDWYALGVMVCEALHDNSIQYVSMKEKISPNEARELIRRRGYKKISAEAESFIDLLQKRSPAERLGNLTGKADDVKLHPWFHSINFSDVFEKKYKIDIPCKELDPEPIDFDSDFWKDTADDPHAGVFEGF